MKNFISVNGRPVDLEDALYWSIIEDSPSFLQASRDREVLRQHALNSGFDVTAEELQDVVDKVRRGFGLESAEDTQRWLDENHLTFDRLKSACGLLVLQEKIWQSFPEDEIAAYYEEHAEEFVQIDLYGCRVGDRKTADRLVSRIRDGEANFHLETMAHSLDEESAPMGGYIGRLTRDQVPEEISVSVFSVDVGDIIGPVKLHDGFAFFTVTGIFHPSLDDCREDIRNHLFDELIERLTDQAVVSHPIFGGA